MEYELGLRDYIAMLKRRLVLIIVVIPIVIMIAVGAAVLLPPVYESKGTILIESQQIPTDLVKSSVDAYADERIEGIKQRVMTRENLLAMIEKYHLYDRERNTMTVTEIVDDLRNKIKVIMLSANKGNRGSNSTIAFTVGAENRYPDLAHKVANEIVTLFLAENVKARTTSATETTEFFIKEGERLKAELEEVERKVAEYKEANANSLPEYKDMNQNMVIRMDTAVQDLDREYKTTQEELRYLDIELASAKAGIGLKDADKPVTAESELEKLKSEYTIISGQYTESHPSVKRLKAKIEMLEKLEANKSKQPVEVDKGENKAVTEAALRVEKVEAQITSAKARLESLVAQKAKMKSDQIMLQQKIMQAPQVERGLINLLRDYENAKQKYTEIRSKEINAKMRENLEQDNKGERFALIEPPAFPEKPVRPNRTKIIALGVFAAFGLAIGLVFALESIDKRVRGGDALTSLIQMTPLVSIPYIVTDIEIRQHKRLIKMIIAAIVGAILIALALVHFLYIPLDLLVIKIMSRF